MDPFSVPELNIKPVKLPKTRTTCPSRIEDLSVGAIRYSFLQMRSCKDLNVDFVLWTGLLAGHFALSYLLMSSSMQKKSKKSAQNKLHMTPTGFISPDSLQEEEVTAEAVDEELNALPCAPPPNESNDNDVDMDEVD